jgi:hypothetical protein
MFCLQGTRKMRMHLTVRSRHLARISYLFGGFFVSEATELV